MRQTSMRSIVITFIILVFAIVGTSLLVHHLSQHGYLNLSVQAPSSSDLKVSINGKTITTTGLNTTIRLGTGLKTLTITDAGFKPFRTSFTIHTNQTLLVNAVLQSSAQLSATAASNSLNSFLSAKGLNLQSATYFYNNTWAFINISFQGDLGYGVVRYSSTTQTWSFALSPGTYFTKTDIQSLPLNVQTYMIQNHEVSQATD